MVALACQGPLDVEAPVAMVAGEAQHQAAAMVRHCTGLSVDVRDVRWFAVESIEHDVRNLGGWEPPDIVYLVRSALNDVKVSAHELVHHVLRGDPKHSGPLWAICGVWP